MRGSEKATATLYCCTVPVNAAAATAAVVNAASARFFKSAWIARTLWQDV